MKILLLLLIFINCLFVNFTNAQKKKLATKETIDTNNVEKIIEIEAEFPGGDNEYAKYLEKNIKYPQSAVDSNITGTVLVEFIVCENGDVCHAKVVKSVNKELDAEALKAIKNSVKWKPGTQNGMAVSSYRTVPITFELDEPDSVILKSDSMLLLKSPPPMEIFTYVEQIASYKDGDASFKNYIKDNLTYPQSALENKIEGTVLVKFIVSSEGKVSNVQVIKSVNRALDMEAVRLIQKSNNWLPGMQNGRPVNCYLTLPIVFTIN